MTDTVLVVDDDREIREALAQTLDLHDFSPLAVGSFIEAKDHISSGFDGVILSDIRMPGRDGFHLLAYAHEVDPDLPVILLTGEGDVPMAVNAMSQGAFDFLEKPCAPAALVPVLQRALGARRLVLENRRLKKQLETGDPAARMLFGTSDHARELRQKVRVAAGSRTEVLVTGPPGAGVSKVAEVVHLMSDAATGPFVKKPGGALDPTGFRNACEAAQGGSLFIDEIQMLPVETQFEALEQIERGTDFRVIAGSTADMRALAGAGQFNADLFYRLEGVTVRIPALSERPEDIPVLFPALRGAGGRAGGLACPRDYAGSPGRADGAGLARQRAVADECGDALRPGYGRRRDRPGGDGPCGSDGAGRTRAAYLRAAAPCGQRHGYRQGAAPAAQDLL